MKRHTTKVVQTLEALHAYDVSASGGSWQSVVKLWKRLAAQGSGSALFARLVLQVAQLVHQGLHALMVRAGPIDAAALGALLEA